MNAIEKKIEKGKAIIRKEGITFSRFKTEVTSLLINPKFDEDFWVWLYQCYAEGRATYVESIENWAQEHFKEFTIKEQGTRLKPKKYDCPNCQGCGCTTCNGYGYLEY